MRRKQKRVRVSFTTTRKITMPVKISFTTRAGERVSFDTTKRVTCPVKVAFYVRPRLEGKRRVRRQWEEK